jgi:hypothetical protein
MIDQKKLEEVAKTVTNSNVREAAVKKLTDQSVLADIGNGAYMICLSNLDILSLRAKI